MADPHYNRSHRWKKHRVKRRRKRPAFRKIRKSRAWKAVWSTVFSKGFFGNLALLAGVVVVLGVIIFGLAYIFIGRNLPDPNSLQDRSVAQSTKLYDKTGEHLLFEVFVDEKRTLVKLEELPQDLIDAVIATEDTKFYEHHGIRPLSILRAVIYGMLPGERIGGTSTLTQQLVKNAILTNERSYIRKFKEVILSLRLEQKYTKDEILQIYFNEIPYGSTNYGIESASLSYFGKNASELDLVECATLAGLPQAPTAYLNDPERLLNRRNFVLRRMYEEGYITESEKDEAQASELTLDREISDIVAPHFVFYVKEMLEEEYGQREVEEGGLKVTTTIDYDLQVYAQEQVKNSVAERGESLGFSNAALVAIDPENGHILSMVGSHDYFDEESDGAVNVTTRPRQPGSSIKPMAYTALFEAGYTPNTVFYDVETTFPSDVGPYNPRNYDLEERGPITVRSALQGSLNIPAVKALYMVGVGRFLDFVDRMGYTTFGDRSRFGLAVVLGGGEVTLLEHTNAYATLANDGVRHDTVPILKIEDSEGEVLFEWEEAPGERVIDSNVVATITNVLADDPARQYAFGGGSNLQMGSRPVAAKTGTTNDYRDGWTLGYTPSIAVGVWGGNNDNSKMNRGVGGSTVAAPIWNRVMHKYLDGTVVESFPTPDIPSLGKPALDGDLGAAQTLIVDKITGLLATDETPIRLREEKTFVTHHSILHYVDRGDITGPAPGVDSNDPQYRAWEDAVADWVRRQEEEFGDEFVNEEAPTEYDDVHIAANTPDVKIKSPDNGDSLESRDFEVDVRVGARREVARVEVYIDGFYVGSTSNSPYEVDVEVPSFIGGGMHTLEVRAYDDVENEGIDDIRIELPENEMSSIQIVDPQPNQTIVANSTTYPIRLELGDPGIYSEIEFFVGPRYSSGGSIIGSITSPSSYIESFTWTLPEPGEYVLSAKATHIETGEAISAGNVIVTIEAPPPVEEEVAEE